MIYSVLFNGHVFAPIFTIVEFDWEFKIVEIWNIINKLIIGQKNQQLESPTNLVTTLLNLPSI